MAHALSEPTTLARKHTFIRSYQACVPCRKRKVRCDLGDPGNPADPPCRRCRREHKDCFFQDLRTKKGGSSKPNESPRPTKKARPSMPANSATAQPNIPSTSRPDTLGELYSATTSTHIGHSVSPNDSATAERILHKEVHNANEALNLLYEAAAESRSVGDKGTPTQSGVGARFSDSDDVNTLAWRDFWCVKAGWMTDVEARCYVDFFFDNLNPLAPLISQTFRENHDVLAKSEHALANTILTISARYHALSGVGGNSRSYAIHDRLWRYTRNLLSKLPFSGSRAVRKPGMVESLLLLTEWHPRSYHFPDDDPTEECCLPSGKDDSDETNVSDGSTESSLEPAYRSDRMCWCKCNLDFNANVRMLLANAVCLAYDIGIFDEEEDSRAVGSASSDPDQRYRKIRLQHLCYTYVHSFSARYGRGSALLPKHVTVNTERWINQDNYRPPFGAPEEDWRYIWGAVGLTKLMKNASEVLFANKRRTRDLLMNGGYTSLLSHFEPLLQSWKQGFDQHPPQSEQSKLMLLVEWEYIRLYINSLALQAVAERESSQTMGIDGQAVQISEDDAIYIDHVVDASKSILNYMIYEFTPRGYLRLSPVKVFLRIISAAVFLVKALALGRGPADLNTSFSLLDSTVQILRMNSVDDLHLANRFSVLLESVLKHIRTRFLPGQTIPDLTGADDLLGLSGEVTPGLLPFDSSLAPFGVGVGKTWLGADGGGMEFLEWLMKGDELNSLVP